MERIKKAQKGISGQHLPVLDELDEEKIEEEASPIGNYSEQDIQRIREQYPELANDTDEDILEALRG